MIYYTIASTVRTGSSTLCDQLRANEIGYPLEQYAYPYRRLPIKAVGGYSGLNAMPGHIKKGAAHLDKSTGWIYLYREDILNQAISWAIAIQTGNFAHNPTRKDPELIFNYYQIGRSIERLKKGRAIWEEYFVENNITPYRLSYEQFVSNRDIEFNKVLNYLGADPVTDFEAGTDRVKQSCVEKETWPIMYQECLDGTREKIKVPKQRRPRGFYE